MKENVGRTDQALRAVAGPLLLTAGYAWLGGKNGKGGGLLTMVAGAFVTETALTRTCPLNELLGIDTTRFDERIAGAMPAVSPFLHVGAAGDYASEEEAVARGIAAEATESTGEEEEGGRRGPIAYGNFVHAASSLSFIRDEATAEAAIKAVLGILASRLEEPEAARLVASLPEELRYSHLRGHQATVTDLSVDQYYNSLAKQFRIDHDQAQVLAVTILRLVRESLDSAELQDIERSLPDEWTHLIERI